MSDFRGMIRRFSSYSSKSSKQPATEALQAETNTPTPENSCIFQSFEWHSRSDRQHYKRLLKALPEYKRLGITALWLPPGSKSANSDGNGYDLYDLWDLGEFDQKGSRSTKWGSKEDLLELSRAAKEIGIELYFDAVLGHRAGADRCEKVRAVKVDENDRNKVISDEQDMEAWTGFDFPGRGEKYSSFKYNASHFNAVDWNQATNEKALFRLSGHEWAKDVDLENGNYDYLMFANLDYSCPEIIDEVKKWGVWAINELSLSGFRIDAARHISQSFILAFINHLQSQPGNQNLTFIAEYWSYHLPSLTTFINATQAKCLLYDAPLLQSFLHHSQSPPDTTTSDLRQIFTNTLVHHSPANALTLVTNHDTQPGQVMSSPIAAWFKDLAYTLILLRQHGKPCIFFGDLYGLPAGPEPQGPACSGRLGDLMLLRRYCAYGVQTDYFFARESIGWVRLGTWDRRDGLVVLMSSNPRAGARKSMNVGKGKVGEVWIDVYGGMREEVNIDRGGNGMFSCPPRGVSVWVRKGGVVEGIGLGDGVGDFYA